MAGFGRSADTESTIAAVRARRRRRRRGPRHAAGARRRPCGSGRAMRPSTAATRGRSCASWRGLLAGRRLASSSSSATRRSPRARWSASPSRSGAWVPPWRRPTDTRHSSFRRLLHGIDYEPPGRVGAGEVGDPARGAAGGRPHDRGRADPDARPHRAHARARGRASRVARRASRSSEQRGSSPFGRGPGGHLVGGAVPRRRRNRPGLIGHGARGRPQSSTDRHPRRARADGRADRDLQPTLDRRRAGRRRRGSRVRLVGATILAAEVPSLIDELPILAVAACHARGETIVRGAGELRAKESDRIEAVVELLHRIGGHIRATRDGFRIKGVPARLGAASSTPTATIGWRCWARSPVSRRARGGAARSGGGGGQLRLLRGARARSRTARFTTLPRHDRGDRRAGRLWEEHRRVDSRASARLPLPRHGGHVSRADLIARRDGADLTDGGALARLAPRIPSRSGRTGTSRSTART